MYSKARSTYVNKTNIRIHGEEAPNHPAVPIRIPFSPVMMCEALATCWLIPYLREASTSAAYLQMWNRSNIPHTLSAGYAS